MKAFFKKYNITDLSQLHSYKIKHTGRDANKIKNPIVKHHGNYIMYCEKDTEVLLDDMALVNIAKFEEEMHNETSFYKMANGYIATHVTSDKCLYIHQIITGHYGHGQGTSNFSVDHIDRNPLNNCYSNLRVVDRKTQEQNSKGIMDGTKRERKKSAKALPEGLTHDMMPKYVVYYHEQYATGKYREFFKIEKHPKSTKIIIGTKSGKIPILEKLRLIKQELDKINNSVPTDIKPEPHVTNTIVLSDPIHQLLETVESPVESMMTHIPISVPTCDILPITIEEPTTKKTLKKVHKQ
jgi:hypothetical protein